MGASLTASKLSLYLSANIRPVNKISQGDWMDEGNGDGEVLKNLLQLFLAHQAVVVVFFFYLNVDLGHSWCA
jgi:hypothetical protein